jgi:hypothetical protein
MKKWMRRAGKYLTVPSCFAIALLFFSFLPAEKYSLSKASAPSTAAVANSDISKSARHEFSFADSSRLNLLYDSLQLSGLGLSTQAYHKAVTGFLNLVESGSIPNPGVLSIIDFSLPSTQKRLFIVDTYNGKLLFSSLVAHGRNSGGLMATRFSNRRNSLMSSLGFYLTGQAFIGQHGYSMRLEGMEKGFNDNVFSRAIIMHPAGYVSEDHIRQWGFLGRSEGCPAIPEQIDSAVIDVIRDGSCLFIYSPDKRYLHQSRLAS